MNVLDFDIAKVIDQAVESMKSGAIAEVDVTYDLPEQQLTVTLRRDSFRYTPTTGDQSS